MRTILVIGEEYGKNIWPVHCCAGEPPEMKSGQQVQTGLNRQFSNDHDELKSFGNTVER